MDPSPTVALVTCSIDMRFATEVLGNAVRVLLNSVGRTEAKRGCRECTVARDAIEAGRVCYSEVWDSMAPFQRHLRSDEFRLVLLAMDMCLEEPRVLVGDLAGRSGIAYLRELREAAAAGSE